MGGWRWEVGGRTLRRCKIGGRRQEVGDGRNRRADVCRKGTCLTLDGRGRAKACDARDVEPSALSERMIPYNFEDARHLRQELPKEGARTQVKGRPGDPK